MKKWSLLSIPLVGLASISVWAQAVAGAPADQFSGVVVREPSPADSVLNIDGFTKRPNMAPIATPKPTSRSLKSEPLNPATSPASKAAEAPDAGNAATGGFGHRGARGTCAGHLPRGPPRTTQRQQPRRLDVVQQPR